jgi:hypothetical protein
VLITLRTGEPAPDIVTSLWKDDHLPRLDLAPLDAEESTQLIARVLGGPVDTASAHRLWTLTEGSPLFLRHLLAGEMSAGRFTAASGIWRWTSEPAISPELAGLLEREIGDLAAGVRDVVDMVALAEPVAVPTLSALTSVADLEEAEGRGLVRTDGLVARLAHPLYGEVRRAAMGTLRARPPPGPGGPPRPPPPGPPPARHRAGGPGRPHPARPGPRPAGGPRRLHRRPRTLGPIAVPAFPGRRGRRAGGAPPRPAPPRAGGPPPPPPHPSAPPPRPRRAPAPGGAPPPGRPPPPPSTRPRRPAARHPARLPRTGHRPRRPSPHRGAPGPTGSPRPCGSAGPARPSRRTVWAGPSRSPGLLARSGRTPAPHGGAHHADRSSPGSLRRAAARSPSQPADRPSHYARVA